MAANRGGAGRTTDDDDGGRSGAGHGPPWRVLLVDDSRDDAELAELALRDGGVAVECRRVYTEQALRAALVEFAPDVVLSDVNIPGFDGTEAQAVVREHDPSLPFVFLTGSLHVPDPAPPGADALVLKDDLPSLPGLLRRLLGR
ncbi:response regulator [Luteimonas sp. SJ-92]|uniref:Response regulator n=1 Tax=Luteimonas salinisoli TaxID=2752307 RepID=A0A853JEG6_9GAMM|nr:response regulator [Luteimonas salinisoli]NZA27245.1 response regulator [Luteimonas salinisoli]